MLEIGEEMTGKMFCTAPTFANSGGRFDPDNLTVVILGLILTFVRKLTNAGKADSCST